MNSSVHMRRNIWMGLFFPTLERVGFFYCPFRDINGDAPHESRQGLLKIARQFFAGNAAIPHRIFVPAGTVEKTIHPGETGMLFNTGGCRYCGWDVW